MRYWVSRRDRRLNKQELSSGLKEYRWTEGLGEEEAEGTSSAEGREVARRREEREGKEV